MIAGMTGRVRGVQGRKAETLPGRPRTPARTLARVGRNVGKKNGESNKMPVKPAVSSNKTIDSALTVTEGL
jgi:hypothetical protein